jgi:hypothetical protein
MTHSKTSHSDDVRWLSRLILSTMQEVARRGAMRGSRSANFGVDPERLPEKSAAEPQRTKPASQ